jgi:homoaconitate hydratase
LSEVVFLAGGTGIAPAMQAVRAVLGEGGEDKDKKVKILWANRRRDECAGAPVPTPWYAPLSFWGAPSGVDEPPSPLVEELRGLEARYAGQVEVRYFIDAEGTFIDRKGILDALREGGKKTEGKKMIMVAGPEGFVKYYVGARVWEGGEEKQGPLGGVVKGLGLAGWQVVKL